MELFFLRNANLKTWIFTHSQFIDICRCKNSKSYEHIFVIFIYEQNVKMEFSQKLFISDENFVGKISFSPPKGACMALQNSKKRRQSHLIPSCTVQAVQCTLYTSCLIAQLHCLSVRLFDSFETSHHLSCFSFYITSVHMIWYQKICVFAQKAANWFRNKHCTVSLQTSSAN